MPKVVYIIGILLDGERGLSCNYWIVPRRCMSLYPRPRTRIGILRAFDTNGCRARIRRCSTFWSTSLVLLAVFRAWRMSYHQPSFYLLCLIFWIHGYFKSLFQKYIVSLIGSLIRKSLEYTKNRLVQRVPGVSTAYTMGPYNMSGK